MFKKVLAVCLVSLFTFSVVSGTCAACKSAPEIKDIHVKLNENFTIDLDSNPSTGYAWNSNYDPNFLKLAYSYYMPTDENCLGAAGTDIFVFEAVHSGETNITFNYQRNWEPYPSEVIIYHISVDP